MCFCSEGFPLPLGALDGLRYFIVALPKPSINYFAQGNNAAEVGFEPSTSLSGVRRSTNEPPHSPML